MTPEQINNGTIPKKGLYAQVTSQIVVSEDMRCMSTVDYVKNIVKKNNFQRPTPPKVTVTPVICDPMEKMASIIGIKNINWSEVRQHHSNNFAMKSNDGHEALAKSGVNAEARIRHAAILIIVTLKIEEEK